MISHDLQFIEHHANRIIRLENERLWMMAAKIDPRTKIVLCPLFDHDGTGGRESGFAVGIGIISIACALLMGVQLLALIRRYQRILVCS